MIDGELPLAVGRLSVQEKRESGTKHGMMQNCRRQSTESEGSQPLKYRFGVVRHGFQPPLAKTVDLA